MRELIEKVVATLALITYAVQIVPAVEYKSTMERSRARLDYYIERAAGAVDEKSWEENAERSIEQAIKEWENEHLNEKETDPEGYEKKQEEVRTYLSLEKESKYIEWLTERFTKKARNEALKELTAELKKAIRSYRVEGYEADEAEKLQEDIKAETEEIIERYIDEYEKKYGLENPELTARIRAKGISEGTLRDVKEYNGKEGVITEARLLARTEGSRLVARFQSDTKSLRAENREKAAGVIAGQITEKATKESREKIEELLTKLETNLEKGDKEEYSKEVLLDQFQEVFNQGLTEWEKAEQEFLTNRAEWEKEAEETTESVEKVWKEAYREIEKARTEWAESIQEKIKELQNKIDKENKEQEKKVEGLLEKYRAVLEEEVSKKQQAAQAQKAIYNNLRSGLGTVTEGLNAFKEIFETNGGNEKYKGLYSYWKTEAEGQVEKVDEELIKKVKERIEEENLTGDTKAESFKSWLEQAEQYNKRIKETIETIKTLSEEANESEGKNSFLELEIYKARAQEKYWEEEKEIAKAVEEYAETKDSTRESKEETEKRLKESNEAYEKAWKSYEKATEELKEYSKKTEEAEEELQKAYKELAEKKEVVEQIKAEYQLLYAQSQGLEEETVVRQIYTNIKYYEESEKKLKEAEKEYEKFCLIKALEEEKDELKKNAEDSFKVYNRLAEITDGIIEKVKAGSKKEYEEYLNGIKWEETYKTENGLYGKEEYLKEKYNNELTEINSCLNEIEGLEFSEKSNRYKEIVKRIYIEIAQKAAEYIKKCEAYKKAGLEGNEPDEDETEKYSEKAKKELEANSELKDEEKDSINNLIALLSKKEIAYELKLEEKKASLKADGVRYNEAKVRENNQKETKRLLKYIEENESKKGCKGGKYDSVIEYCIEISKQTEKCGNVAAKTATKYIDSYLRQEALKYQAESGKTQETYKAALNRLSEEIEEKIQNNQENDYEKLIVEYKFLSYAHEEAEENKWVKILDEEKFSKNKKLEKKEAEYIEEFLKKNTDNSQEEQITEAKKSLLKAIADSKDLTKEEINEETEKKYNAIKEASESYLAKLQICTDEYKILKEEVNTDRLEAKLEEIKKAEEEAYKKTEEYQKSLEKLHKAGNEYEKKVEETNEKYRKSEESRKEKRKAQAVYDWAESIYLKTMGENTDENCVTPKEQLSEAEYAYKKAKQTREILEATAENRKKEKITASEEEKAYIESDRNYYLAYVLNSRLQEKIEQEKQKLGEAETKESEARKGVVKKVSEARTTTKASVTKDENGEYHYSLYGSGNNAEEQKSFWENEEILEHEVIADEVITAGEKEVEKWLSKMLSNEGNFRNVIIASLLKDIDDDLLWALHETPNLGNNAKSAFYEAAKKLVIVADAQTNDEDIAECILFKNSDSVYSSVIKDLSLNIITGLASMYVYWKMKSYEWFQNSSKYYALEALKSYACCLKNYENSMQKLSTSFKTYEKRREERKTAEKEYYKALYGQEEKPAEKLSGREVKKELKASFSEYKDFSQKEIEKILSKISDEETFTDTIEAMNIALERFYADYKNKKEALEESLAEKAKLQKTAAEKYNKEVQEGLQVKEKDKKALRDYALKASDSKLSVSERKEWAKKYDALYEKIEKVTDSKNLKKLAKEAYGENTFNLSEDYKVLAEYYQKYLNSSDYSYSKLNMNKAEEPFWSNGNINTDTDMLSRYYGLYEKQILSQANKEYKEYEISLETEYRLYKKENSDILKGVYDVARIAADEWNKAEEKLNAQYNQWHKTFIERYEEAGKEWQENYEEFLSDKQQWITRMYVSAASETGYTGIRADEEARKSLTKTRERMVKNISRESFDAGEYVRDLIGSSLIGKLNSHLDTIAGRTEGVHFAEKIHNKNTTSSAENLLNAMKVLSETSAMMKKTACKKAAQEAEILLDKKIDEAYSGIDTTNKNVEESIDSMLYGAGYLKSGNLYARKVLAHSYLVEDVYKIQAIAGYNWYNTARPELRISSAMFEGLETDGIITLMNTATMELEDWQARIFGVHDGVREIKGEIERHIGSKQDYGSEIGRIMFQYDRNEKEKDAGKAEFEAAPWDKQITESPCSWVEVPSLRSVVTTAAAVYSAVVTTVATTALSVASFGTLSAPMAALCAAGIGAAITLSAEATFAVADVAGGYRDWDEVGKDLAISAATSVISAVGGAAGAAIKGIGGIGGALLKTGVSMSTSATSTVATNAIKYAGDWNGFASSMASFDTWSGVITSGAGSLISNSLNVATIGDNGVKVTGFSSMNISDMQNLNSVVGGLASSGLEYGLTGKTTLNVLNIADIGINSLVNLAIGNTNAPVNASCGLLEVHLDNSQGASFALGTGGTDLSIGTVASAARGFDALKTNFEINHYTNKNDLQNAAIALRTQYGFGGKTENTQLKEILKGKTELKAGSGDGNAQTVRENGKRVVYLNGYSDNMTKEEQMKLGITLGHEAYRDGIKGDEIAQKIETHEAVAGHTDMMTRMLGDNLYAASMAEIIEGDKNLQLDLIARVRGEDFFNAYVDDNYDSSADYWLLKTDGTVVWDGSKDLNAEYYDENGQLHTNDKSEENYKSSATPYTVVKAGKDATYAGTLAEYVGEERAEQILSSSGKNINDAGSYSKTALMDIFGVSEEVATQMQHTGRLPSSMTPEQKQRLIGEALMANGGMTWDGKSRGNTNSFSLAMSDHDIGQIVINPIYDSDKNIIGYDRFGITAEVYRDELSYSSTRNETSTHLAINGKQGLDYMYLYKKDLNGNTIASTMNEPFSKGWQTVANGFADPDMETMAYPSFNIKDGYSDNVYRGSTVVENQSFYMRFGNFTSTNFVGNVFIINRAQTMLEGIAGLTGKTLSSTKPIEGHSNYLTGTKNNPEPHEDLGGLISASCFMNSRDNLNKINSWVMNYVPYPYDVKTVVYPKYGPMWR